VVKSGAPRIVLRRVTQLVRYPSRGLMSLCGRALQFPALNVFGI
jgi:hypothetical protein